MGQEFAYNDKAPPTPSWIAFNAAASWGAGNNQIRATLAHELMHAVDDLFKKKEGNVDRWRSEGMGVWAENFVYPDNGTPNLEWKHAKWFFSNQSPVGGQRVSDVLLPLTRLTTNLAIRDELEVLRLESQSAYSKYIFFFFRERRYGATLLKSMLETEEFDVSVAAIHNSLTAAGVANGFAAAWADFGVAAWNSPGTGTSGLQSKFREWDNGLPHGMFEEFARGLPLDPCEPVQVGSEFSPWLLGLKCDEARMRFPSTYLEKPAGIYVGPLSTVWMHAKFSGPAAGRRRSPLKGHRSRERPK
jgi:hypothetical protein